jgi:hydroxyethylthiazole kinase
VLNIGTLDKAWVESMILAAKTANAKGIPVILDPVGAGATKLRTEMTLKILAEANISVLRGNASEIFSLISDDIKTRGVDSSLSVSHEMADAARKIAIDFKCVIAISGKDDLITDGKRTLFVSNGCPIMTRVTGIGCGLTAVVAAFCAVGIEELLLSATAAHAFYGLCGDLAYESVKEPASFFIRFQDLLYSAGEKEINAHLRVKEAA